MNQEIIISLIVLIVIGLVIFYISISRSIKKRAQKYVKTHDEIMDLEAKVKSELSRTKKISKNEESIKLFDEWLYEYEQFSGEIEIISHLTTRIKNTATFAKRKDFNSYASELNIHLDGFQERLLVLYNKINKYTSYELENTRISLELKERIKNLTNEFDANLRYLEIYNQSFDNEIIHVNDEIANFEALQREGEYPEGRTLLKTASQKIDTIDYVLSLIIDLQTYINRLNTQIEKIEIINAKITKLNFSINLKDFDAKLAKFKVDTNNLLNEVTYIDFNHDIDKDELRKIKTDLKNLDADITEYKGIVEEKSTYIYEIIEYLNNNEELINQSEEILSGAYTEKEKISKLYQHEDINKYVEKIEHQISQYQDFKVDYQDLITIIYDGKEDYANLKSRIIKANKYLHRLLKNVSESILALRDIRVDEIQAHEMLQTYQRNIIEIDLYLRGYNHHNLISSNFKNMLVDLEVKLEMLENELQLEPINITNVRNLNTSVAKLINEITTTKAQENIKQREAAKYLIIYFNRFTHTQDGINYARRFNTLFNDHDYKRILKESFELLKSSNKDGEQIYKQIVNQVHVEPFEHVLTPNIEQ